MRSYVCVECGMPGTVESRQGPIPQRCRACNNRRRAQSQAVRRTADGHRAMRREEYERLRAEGPRCVVDGCPNHRASADGLCRTHYSHIRRYGEIRPVTYRQKRDNINAQGYRRFRVDGRNVLEHRFVMEQILGRPLWPDENVHHLNGDRADNRAENLELWTTSQPPGQRVPDKVAWAKELLRRYEPEALARDLKSVAS